MDTSPQPHRGRRLIMLVVGVLVGLGLLAVVVLLVFGEQLAGWAGLPLRPDRELQTAVGSALERAEGDDVVVLTDVTDFEWDAVGVFGPYVSHETVVEEMGVPVPRAVTNNTQLEAHCLLVFRGGDRMVGWTTVARNVADCSAAERARVHSPDEARFVADSFERVSSVSSS